MAWLYIGLAIVLAAAQPLFLVIIRHEIRFARLRALYEFDTLFNVSGHGGPVVKLTEHPDAPGAEAGAVPAEPPAAQPQAGASIYEVAPTYEYVRARYTDDIEFPDSFPGAWIRNFDMGQPQFRAFIRSLRWWGLKSSRSLLLASLPLVCLCAYGFATLFSPATATPGSLISRALRRRC